MNLRLDCIALAFIQKVLSQKKPI